MVHFAATSRSKAHISRGHSCFQAVFDGTSAHNSGTSPHRATRRRHRLNGTLQTRRCSGLPTGSARFYRNAAFQLAPPGSLILRDQENAAEHALLKRTSRPKALESATSRDRIAQRNAAGGRNLAGRTAHSEKGPEVGALFSKPARSRCRLALLQKRIVLRKQNLPPQRSARRSLPMVTALSTVQPLAQFHSHTSPVAYRPGTGSKVTSPLPELANRGLAVRVDLGAADGHRRAHGHRAHRTGRS